MGLGWIRSFAVCCLSLLLWLGLVGFPAPPRTSIDASWNEALVCAAGRTLQFGKDVVFTYGPWGYLCSAYHVGDVGAGPRLAWEIMGKLLIAAGLVGCTRRLPFTQQVAFLLACTWLAPLFPVSFYLIVIGISVVAVLLRTDEPRWAQLACVFLLAFLSLLKFTDLVLAAFGVCVAGAMHGRMGKWRHSGLIVLGYGCSLLFWWAAAGQSLGNIGAYVGWSLEITRGYANAMGVDENPEAYLTGLAIVGGWLLFLFDILRQRARTVESLALALFLGFNGFAWWKYAFTRADAHMDGLFLASFLLAIALPPMLFPHRRWHGFWIVGLIGLLGFAQNEPGELAGSLEAAPARILDNLASLARVRTIPERWKAELHAASEGCRFPATDKAVGGSSIDLFNFDQGIVILNGLNYTPRPVFQSYSAYTPALSRLNLSFYQSASAPSYVLWRQEVLDRRFPTMDDAPLVPEMARSYEPQFVEKHYLLLRRVRDMPAQPLRRILLSESRSRLGDVIAVPPSNGTPLWLQARFTLNGMGSVRALLYKPPQLSMNVVSSDGEASTWRILPDVAADGFLLVPFLNSTSEFAEFLRGRGRMGIRSIQLAAPGRQDRFWNREFVLRFWAMPELSTNLPR